MKGKLLCALALTGGVLFSGCEDTAKEEKQNQDIQSAIYEISILKTDIERLKGENIDLTRKCDALLNYIRQKSQPAKPAGATTQKQGSKTTGTTSIGTTTKKSKQ
jgi:outer membrane murein-binding lipoprotein Lpp